MMDNMAAVVFLGSGPQAKSTHEYISETLSTATADKKDDRMSFGINSSSDLSFSKAELKLMTPGQVRRMPPTECIIFLESRPPIYDTKAIPFDKPEYGFIAADWLKKRYSDTIALGDYEHPVHTIYDPKTFKYITLSREKNLEIIQNEDDIAMLKKRALRDSSIYACEVDERDLLYLSFDKNTGISRDEIEYIYRQAVEEADEDIESIKGLALLHDVDVKKLGLDNNMKEHTDKSGWTGDTFAELMGRYFDLLSDIEKEVILTSMDEGFSDEQMKALFLCDVSDMENMKRAYGLQNSDIRGERK